MIRGADGNINKCNAKKWCFTLNNYDAQDVETFKALEDQVSYGCCGYQTAPTTGTPHLQGYLHFKKRMRDTQVRAIFSRARWAVAVGDDQQNEEYCSGRKDGTPNEYDTIGEAGDQDPGPMERNRWKRSREAAVTGNLDAVDDQIFICHYGNLQKIKASYMKHAEELGVLENYWLWGPPGCGKSMGARTWAKAHGGAFYPKIVNKWWDGYQGEEIVIIDDFDPSHGESVGRYLKIWVDHYPFIAETKGGSMSIRPKHFIVTSNYHPDDVQWDPQCNLAIKRRFKIEWMGDGPEPGKEGSARTFVMPETHTSKTIVLQPQTILHGYPVASYTDEEIKQLLRPQSAQGPGGKESPSPPQTMEELPVRPTSTLPRSSSGSSEVSEPREDF